MSVYVRSLVAQAVTLLQGLITAPSGMRFAVAVGAAFIATAAFAQSNNPTEAMKEIDQKADEVYRPGNAAKANRDLDDYCRKIGQRMKTLNRSDWEPVYRHCEEARRRMKQYNSGGTAVLGMAPTSPTVIEAGLSASTSSIYVGGDLAFGATWNTYDDFPAFSSSGIGGGGHIGVRFYVQPNLFIGGEAGLIGTDIRGTNPDGAFANYHWEAWQMGMIGVTWTPSGLTTPVTVFGGAGFAQGRINVGVENDFVHEDMSKTLTGFAVRSGVEIQVTPKVSLGASYMYSQFKGSIDTDPVKTQINTLMLSIDYRLF